MRILQVNKFHYNRGGADKYYLELGKAQAEAGHNVAYFSMQHPQNFPSPYSPYFVSRLSFNEGGLVEKLKTPGRVIYSLEAKRKFWALLKEFRPEIIHLHNIYHQISPSILSVARKYKIPVVMHLHDYKLLCPNYQFFLRGEIYEDFKPDHYFNCFKTKCFRDSYLSSFLVSLEMTIHHKWLKIYKKNIARYLAPSQFMKDKLVEYGYSPSQVDLIYNPFSPSLDLSEEERTSLVKQDYLLYFGRLSQEKGLFTLLDAIAKTKIKLKIAGEGPLEAKLQAKAKELGLEVDFLGFKSGSELKALIAQAKATVIPSIWYENMPLSLLESLNLGTAVIASEIGGLPEMIKPGVNGFLFKPRSSSDLAKKIEALLRADSASLSAGARASVSQLTMADNLSQVMAVYQSLVKPKKAL